jgi:hypothetical protein
MATADVCSPSIEWSANVKERCIFGIWPTLNAHDRKAIERIVRDGLEDAALARGFAITEGADPSTTTRCPPGAHL